jgi:ribonuclease E
MKNRILINATHMQEELRVAVTRNNFLTHLDIEAIAKQQTKAFIYKGKITRIEPSLEACFVDYGENRHGFLPLKDISSKYFTSEVPAGTRPAIKDVLKEGQELIVQVEKIERGNKGAALTTFITLAGSYLVVMPNSPKAGGVSRRIDGPERTELNEILRQLKKPEDMGVIVRTASVSKSLEELQWDLDILVTLWDSINTVSDEHKAPILIHQESNAMIRALRDYLRQDIEEIVIDQEDVYAEAKKYIQLIRPDFVEKVTYYNEKQPLFAHFKIEQQVESVFKHELRLPSGGALVIDQTEALIAIDINSAKATKGGDIEETALVTNLEAADEISRQLRLRDIGGLIVIDFIDMMQTRNQREVEDRLRDLLRVDRAKVQFGRISRFGLLEMSRQRLRSTLAEATKHLCSHCHGQGVTRAIPSFSLSVLRAIEDNALYADTFQIRAHLPVDVATYLANEKRSAIVTLEEKHGVKIVLIPQIHLELPDYTIERIKSQQRHGSPSYKLAVQYTKENQGEKTPDFIESEPVKNYQPALQTIIVPKKPETKARPTPKKPGLLARLFKALFGSDEKKPQAHSNSRHNGRGTRPPHHNNRRHNNRGRNNNNNNRRRNPNHNARRQPHGNQPQHANRNQQENRGNQENRAPRQEAAREQSAPAGKSNIDA